MVRRTVQLLYKRGRYAEAERVIQILPEQTPLLGDVRRLAAEVSLQSGDYDRALQLAGEAVAANSTDYHDLIWQGQMLWAASQPADFDPAKRAEAERRAESCSAARSN